MRQTQQQITSRASTGSQQGGTQVRSRVMAGGVDALPSYIPNQEDPDLRGLIDGLSAFNPVLKDRMQEEMDHQAAAGRRDGAGGVPQQSDKPSYVESYQHITGLTAGQKDASDLQQKYMTEFDKDNGNLDQFITDHFQAKAGGLPDGSYRNGYDKAFLPTVMELRKDHLEYQKKLVGTKVESSLVQLIDGGTRAYISQNQPIPEGYVDSLQKYAAENLGVPQQRFHELLFETVKRQGDEGHFDVYDTLKKPRADGTPGLYNDPAWRSKIDAAELHSFNTFSARSELERKNRYNRNLYDVFAEDDPRAAQQKFKELKSSGLFQGDAEGFLKWEKLLLEKVDGKPSIDQLEHEGPLMLKAVQGKISYEDVLKEEAAHRITASQRKELFSRIRQTTVENRTLAAQEGAASERIYKSKDFGSALDYIEGTLKPRPQNPTGDFDKRELQFDNAQLAQARREFFTAVEGKKPGELQDTADAVAQRYLKRRQEFSKGGMSDVQKDAVIAAQVPYKSLPELIEAKRRGLVSPAEYRRYSDYIKENNAR